MCGFFTRSTKKAHFCTKFIQNFCCTPKRFQRICRRLCAVSHLLFAEVWWNCVGTKWQGYRCVSQTLCWPNVCRSVGFRPNDVELFIEMKRQNVVRTSGSGGFCGEGWQITNSVSMEEDLEGCLAGWKKSQHGPSSWWHFAKCDYTKCSCVLVSPTFTARILI